MVNSSSRPERLCATSAQAAAIRERAPAFCLCPSGGMGSGEGGIAEPACALRFRVAPESAPPRMTLSATNRIACRRTPLSYI